MTRTLIVLLTMLTILYVTGGDLSRRSVLRHGQGSGGVNLPNTIADPEQVARAIARQMKESEDSTATADLREWL